jgi:alkylated DNA repair dioxygenase AlkB
MSDQTNPPSVDAELAKVKLILQQNRGKNFVQRILNPDLYPKLRNSDNTVSTHKMAWVEDNGKYYVYPTIYPDENNPSFLIDESKTPLAAWARAKETKDFIMFNTPTEADWFSQHYKDVWTPDQF